MEIVATVYRFPPDVDPTSFRRSFSPRAEITHRIDVRRFAAAKRAAMAAHASQAAADDGADRTLAAFLRIPAPLFALVAKAQAAGAVSGRWAAIGHAVERALKAIKGRHIDVYRRPPDSSADSGRYLQNRRIFVVPQEDVAGYVDGERHAIGLQAELWQPRPYQTEAAEGFWHGGSGVVVLPCGSGKTIVGALAMALAQATTLILVTNTVAARQWRDELLRRTTLTADEIGEYSGAKKEIRPVTIATYQVMTTKRQGIYPHLEVFDSRDWGLIIYDEVHLLPAPIFRFTADIQSSRRLGLTATLVREDGRESDVFSLIGPKRYDAPGKDVENQG